MSLKPLNDEAEALDLCLCSSKLGSIAVSPPRQIAHQLAQSIDVIRESIDVDGHASE